MNTHKYKYRHTVKAHNKLSFYQAVSRRVSCWVRYFRCGHAQQRSDHATRTLPTAAPKKRTKTNGHPVGVCGRGGAWGEDSCKYLIISTMPCLYLAGNRLKRLKITAVSSSR